MLFSSTYEETQGAAVQTTERMAEIHKLLLKRRVGVSILNEFAGPTNRTYEIRLGAATTISNLRNVLEDLAIDLGVAVVQVTYEEGRLRLMIPRTDREFPLTKDLYKGADTFAKGEFIMGVDSGGRPVRANLKDLPHLLIAGATGADKILCGLMYTHNPRDLRLALVDPKRLELPIYEGLPHLGSKVITEPEDSIILLHELNYIMENRYKTLAKMGLRSAHETGANMPLILVVIDEFADFRATLGSAFELEVLRLAQKSRAAGIHLILATQRPSAKVVTGDIKANFPARLALKASSAVDSRVVLGSSGAETLAGKGDALLLHNSTTIRLQVPYASQKDIEFLKGHYGKLQT
jgi:S-DNA-T family DNA segregation ATPase FtsK/SpoIIIE